MIVDVSMTIRPGAVFRLGTPAVQIAAEGFFHEFEGEYESIMLSLSAHTATHVDLVYLARRLEPERMIGPGKLVDARQCSNREIQLADVDRQVDVERGDFVFFRTGWSELAGTSPTMIIRSCPRR
jgi:kynurenine formamidase